MGLRHGVSLQWAGKLGHPEALQNQACSTLPPGVPSSKALNGGFWGLWEGVRVSTSTYRDTPPTLGRAGVFTLWAGLLLLAFSRAFCLAHNEDTNTHVFAQ